MSTPTSSEANKMIPAPRHALASRSAALVVRGLADLARDSNWLIKKVFTGHTPHLALSSAGQLCAALPLVANDGERVAVYDIELGRPPVALTVPGERPTGRSGAPAAFAWSSTGSDLVAAWPGWGNRLYAFDLHRKGAVGFGEFSHFPTHLARSESGRYLASVCGGGLEARLRLWEAAPDSSRGMPFAESPLREAGGPRTFEEWLGDRPIDPESTDDSTFSAFGRIAFSPDEGAVASVVEIEGEWADDSIVLLDVPTLRCLRTFQAKGHITGLAWTCDSRNLIICSAGQAYRVSPPSAESEPLPFGAELVACHPHLPLCLCFSSWLKSSAKGRLFLARLDQLSLFDEYAAEGVADLSWSRDGSKAYAVTGDGRAYIYELPPLWLVA
jgi:WD40 repeat protein